MATDMLLQLDGIKGETQIKGYTDYIDIMSYSLGASNPSSVATGKGSGAGKVDISSLSVTKVIDASSPILFLKCCQGKHINKGKLVVREAGGDEKKPGLEYLVMKFEQVFVDNISWGGASGGGKPTESIAFSFAKVEIDYSPQKEDGSLDSPIPAGWDVQKNVAAAGGK